jgi:hypothetical protein
MVCDLTLTMNLATPAEWTEGRHHLTEYEWFMKVDHDSYVAGAFC